MSYRASEFNKLNFAFQDAADTILNANSKNNSLQPLEHLLDQYNALINYAEIDYEKKKHRTKEYIENTLSVNRITLQRCFEKLKLPVILPGKLLSTIHYVIQKEIHTKGINQETQTESNLFQGVTQDTQTDSNLFQGVTRETQTDSNFFQGVTQGTQTDSNDFQGVDHHTQTDQNDSQGDNHASESENQLNSNKMPNQDSQNQADGTPEHSQSMANQSFNASQTETYQSVDRFIKYTGNILNYKYNGDPLELNSFIADARMLYKLAKNDETKDFCLDYIKNRLKGRAAEAIPDECASLDSLISALKEKIKPENSTIIEGKILALHLVKNDYTKFTTEAEKLSEALRRTLVFEGITKTKAEELAIKKMIELCRKTTNFEIVKSVLESTKFSTPAEVLAQFVTQSDKARREQKEAQLKNANKTNFKNGNNDNRNKSYNKNRNGNNSNGGQNGNRSNNQNGSRQNRGQNQNQQQNRGRGNFSNNRSNRTEQTIRLIAGSPTTATVEQPQAPQQPQTQFFRLEN